MKEGTKIAGLKDLLGKLATKKEAAVEPVEPEEAVVSVKEAAAYGEELHAAVCAILNQEDTPEVKKASAEMSTEDFLDLCNEVYVAKKASAVAVLIGEENVAKVAEVVADIPVAELVETLQLV